MECLLSYRAVQQWSLERFGVLFSHPWCSGREPLAADEHWQAELQAMLAQKAPEPESMN